MPLSFQPLGDRAIRVQFGDSLSPEVNHGIRRFCRALSVAGLTGVTEWVPAYTTLAVYYEPWQVAYAPLCDILARLEEDTAAVPLSPAQVTEIPVRYGGNDGPDLEDVAAYHSRSATEVIAEHSRPIYLIYMLGFAPGFPYLGGLPDTLATPRLATPRTRVPAGSVGIGGAQTGVYPLETPGGWRILGRTPLRLYDAHRVPAALLRAGDYVRFVPVTDTQYEELRRQVPHEDFAPVRYPYESD